MVSIDKVDYSNAIFYSQFTFDKFFELMVKNDGTTLAFGVNYNSEPCGLIVAEQSPNSKTIWEIKSLFVKKQFRRNGAATALLHALFNELKLRNCKSIIFTTVTSQSSIDEFSKLLIPMGFSPLKKLTVVYRFNAKELLANSKFIKIASAGLFTLPENIHIISMDKVDPKALKELKKQSGTSYPDSLSPFANEHNLEWNSTYFAVTDENKVVGWLTAFSAPGNIILYRSLFVTEEYRKTAVGFHLFNEAVKNHIENHLDKSCLFAIACENYNFERFVSLYFKGTNYEHKKYEFKTTLNL